MKYIIEDTKDIHVNLKKRKGQMKMKQDVLQILKTNRKGDEMGLDSLIADILGNNLKIYPQSFHGGDMNGVHCRKLIANIEMIMDEVNKVALKRLNERMIRNTQELNVQKQDEFRMKIDKFTNLFHVMDIVFQDYALLILLKKKY